MLFRSAAPAAAAAAALVWRELSPPSSAAFSKMPCPPQSLLAPQRSRPRPINPARLCRSRLFRPSPRYDASVVANARQIISWFSSAPQRRSKLSRWATTGPTTSMLEAFSSGTIAAPLRKASRGSHLLDSRPGRTSSEQILRCEILAPIA